MYEHERSLVTELKDKPFALVGYNFRDKLEHIQKATEEKRLIWRSFFGGEEMETLERFGIEAFPTIMIIDANGVIKSVGSSPNDKLIKELISEMEESL